MESRQGPPVLLTRLPAHVRLRLAVQRRVDLACARMIDQGQMGRAERVWKLFRMLRA
jgi:hypothetical protein